MKPKILVIGATGNVGSEVVKILLEQGQSVIAAVRDPAKARRTLGDGPVYLPFDFKQPESFAAAFAGIDKVFLVRPPDISDIKKYVAPAIDAARYAGVEQIVFLSLLGVEKNRVVPHYKIEQSLLTSGIDWTFLRASFFMQNLNTTHLDDIKNRHDVFVPAGKGKTSFIDVRDIAAVAAKTLIESGHRRQAYDLTGKEALDYYQIARDFSEVLARPVQYSEPSALKFGREMYRRKLPLSFIIVMLGIYTTARLGLAARVAPDTARLLGRDPISLRQYIEDYKQVWLA